MDFEEFKQKLVDWMNERYDAEFECLDVIKNNGVHLTSITGRVQGRGISPSIYINDLYNSVQQGMSFGAAATIVETNYAKAWKESYEDVPDVFDFEAVKDKIVARIVNQSMNKELLSGVPYKPVAGDLAITYRYVYSMDAVGVASMLINNQEFEAWNVSIDELHQLAMKNTESMFPAKMESLKDVIYNIMSGKIQENVPEEYREKALADFREEMESFDTIPVYVVSNDVGINGAISVLYPSIQERIEQEFGNDIYVLPSSIHEVLVVPFEEERDKDFFNELVREANASAVDLVDKLSDNIYQIQDGGLVNVNQFEIEIEQALEEAFEEPPENDLGLEM